MFKHTYLLVCMCLLPSFLAAQSACPDTVEFLLEEAHTHVPVADVWLQILETGKGIQTDAEGRAQIDSLCPGTYKVHIHSYLVQDTTLTVYVGEHQRLLRLSIPHSAHQLRQVVIFNRQEKALLQTQEGLNVRAMEAGAGKNISDQLQEINGLSTIRNGATIAKPVIHGLHSNRILMLNNEVRQEDQQWGMEHAPSIDPFAAQELTVLKGAAGVRYGTDAIAGVVLVSPKPIRAEPGWEGHANIAAMSNNRKGVANLYLEHRFSKLPALAFSVQGSVQQAGNYRLPDKEYVANTGMRERNLSLAVQYKKVHSGTELYYSYFHNQLGLYRGSHTGSRQDLYNAINSPVPLFPSGFTYTIDRPKQEVTHQLFKFKTYREGRLGLLQAIYAFQNNYREEYDIVRNSANKDAQLHLRLQTHSLNLHWNFPEKYRIKTQLGTDFVYQHNTFRNGDRVFIPSYYALGAAGYAIARLQAGAYLMEAGLRYDYKHFDMFNPEGVAFANVRYLFDYRNPSATFATKRSWGKSWETMLTLSSAWRAPQANELFSAGYHQGGARVELGDRNLKPESALSVNGDIRYRFKDKLDLRLQVYTQRIDNFIYLSPGAEILTIRGYFKSFYYKQTDAWLSGFDFDARYFISDHWQTHFKAAILRARDRKQKDWLILMPADRMSLDLEYRFSVSPSLKNCFVRAQSSWVAQQKRVPGNFNQIDYPRPPGAYNIYEIEVGSVLSVGSRSIEWRLGADNLFNTRYRDYLDVFRYFLDRPGRNVTFRLNYHF